MRKIMLAAAAAALLSSGSAFAAEDAFYAKLNVGWSKLDKVKGLKSNNDVFFGVGVGYGIMDNFRVDLMFDHFVNPTHKKGSDKLKGDVNTLLVNGYADLMDMDMFKFYLGAGVGAGQVKAKRSGAADNAYNGTAKQKYGLAFAGHVGVSYEFTQGMTAELAYSYRDMGETKKLNGTKYHYRGHHVGVGFRLDI